MATTKVLICVKTYPTLSEKYDELVCTAGFLEDGSLIRIYPVPFRKLDYEMQYRKWQWIELDLVKNTRDFRKESYRPTSIDEQIKILEDVGTENNWRARKLFVVNRAKTNMTQLIEAARNPAFGTSLAILKPTEVIDFKYEPCEREWDPEKLQAVYIHNDELELFADSSSAKSFFQVVNKLPYKFSYVLKTEDGIERTMMIEDWELGALYWNMLKKEAGDEIRACQKVREKYFDYMVRERDLYFFVGTTLKFHNLARNPFIIIGTFYPPKTGELFLDIF